jgi:hypothetical protein
MSDFTTIILAGAGVISVEIVIFAAAIIWKRRQEPRYPYRPGAQHHALVRMIHSANPNSYLVGVETPSIENISLNQPVAISGFMDTKKLRKMRLKSRTAN